MQYEQVSDKEFNERMLLPAGPYAFEVLDATAGVSKTSGADMITLDLLVHADDGSNRKVKAYLVGSDKGKFQVRAFCEATGLMPQYRAGTFNAETCLGRSGWLKLKIEAGRPKDDGSGNWPDKNTVATFLAEAPKKAANPTQTANAPAPVAAPSPAKNDESEDVPFNSAPN